MNDTNTAPVLVNIDIKKKIIDFVVPTGTKDPSIQ